LTVVWRLGLAAALIVWLGSMLVFSSYPKDASDRLLPAETKQGNTPVTIAFMGTSLTAGSLWPEGVVEALAICVKHPVRALRFAKAGVTSVWGLSQTEALIGAHPDIVVMEFAVNDADFRRGLSLAASADNHHAILTRLKQGLPKARIVLMTTNPVLGLRRLLRPRLPAYYTLYHRLAIDQNTGLIDLTPRWLAVPDMAQELTDGLHPTAAAVMSVVVPVVTLYLAGLLGQNCSP
jgi:lysophospholipase L1-like esterase